MTCYAKYPGDAKTEIQSLKALNDILKAMNCDKLDEKAAFDLLLYVPYKMVTDAGEDVCFCDDPHSIQGNYLGHAYANEYGVSVRIDKRSNCEEPQTMCMWFMRYILSNSYCYYDRKGQQSLASFLKKPFVLKDQKSQCWTIKKWEKINARMFEGPHVVITIEKNNDYLDTTCVRNLKRLEQIERALSRAWGVSYEGRWT